jgi:hypothetical protein
MGLRRRCWEIISTRYRGEWLGLDPESSGSFIYWPNQSVTMERSFKFEKEGEYSPLADLAGIRNEGESGGNIPPSSSTQSLTTSTSECTQSRSPSPTKATPTPTPRPGSPAQTDHLGDSFQVPPPDSGWPKQTRTETQKVHDIRSGAAVSSNQPSDPKFTTGVQTVADKVLTESSYSTKPFHGNIKPTYQEAKKGEDWQRWHAAVKQEYETLVANGTWDVTPVPRPEGGNTVDCKWALRVKLNPGGNVEKFKARLMARGFTQVEGVNVFEKYAPVAKMSSLRIILSIANCRDWDIDQFDFTAAFLNVTLDEDEVIFMEQPPDFETADRTKFVLRLWKTIYGLKQSARKWYQLLTKNLAELGFRVLVTDNMVYIKTEGSHITILAIHVDDTTITSSSPQLITHYQQEVAQ